MTIAFVASISQTREKSNNTVYPIQADVNSLEDMLHVAQYDHIMGTYKDNLRADSNFLQANCIVMDCDNDSDNPADWLMPADLARRLPDVPFYAVFSRNHMKNKNGEGARPRWHAYFPLSEIVDNPARIREIKALLLVLVPEFDKAAKDCSRQIFGVAEPKGECYEGGSCIDEYLAVHSVALPVHEETLPVHPEKDTAKSTEPLKSEGAITEGERNSRLFNTALNALTRYGEVKAREVFDKACALCTPPLPAAECSKVWHSAVKTAKAILDRALEKQHKVLTLRVVENTLQELGISVRFNVISREIEVSDLPMEHELMPENYSKLNPYARNQQNAAMLPVFLFSLFKTQHYAVTDRFILDAISNIAAINQFNPFKEMLDATHWDGKDRVYKLYKVLGIQEDTPQNRDYQNYLWKWLLQAVALALNDDCTMSADFVLVLQGGQGCGKTSFFRKLAVRADWFVEGAFIDMNNKDTLLQATSALFTELGEFDATLKREQSSLKGFITRPFDILRAPYARKADRIPRRTSFCATVNPEASIRDDTGSRRFAFIHVEDMDKDFIHGEMTPDWCAQLWRQIYEEYTMQGRDAYHFSAEEIATLERHNMAYAVPLPGENEILELLDWDKAYEEWDYVATVDLMKLKPLQHLSSEKIGRALRKVYARMNMSLKNVIRTVLGCKQYWLPPKKPDNDFFSDD